MSKVHWTTPTLEEFIRVGLLDERQEKFMRTRAAGMSGVQQCFALNVSPSTLGRCLAECQAKYNAVAPYSPILQAGAKI